MEREAERQLNEELLRQSFYGTGEECAAEEHRRTALCYARTEGAVAVLSDLREQRSLVCCGGFAERLGLGLSGGSYVVGSIWEEEVLRRIHPEDLQRKYLLELRFLRWMRQHPARCDCYLCEPLRMSDAAGASLDALHRMFYLAGDAGEGIRWALCLYGPRSLETADAVIVDPLAGSALPFDTPSGETLLSEREREVLGWIEQGLTSKQVAERLAISIHTVSRHRQNILGKLRVGNVVEACRIARNLKLLP